MTFAPLKRSAAFTSIELALVLAATAIISALAFSMYRTYRVRAEISTGTAALVHVKHAVERSFNRIGIPPATLAELGELLPAKSELDDSVRINNGRIEILFGPDTNSAISGRSLYLTPFETADQRVVWQCGNRQPGIGLKPLGFAAGSNVAEQTVTNIDPRFLPPTCR